MDLLIIHLALLCGTIIQGAVGFGFALVAAPILMLLQPELIPGPITLAGLLLTATMTLQGRKEADLPSLGWLLLGFLPGLFIGASLLVNLSQRNLSLLFGFLVITAVAASIRGLAIKNPGFESIIPAGLISGVMSITTSMGGPPVALLFQHAAGPKFRGTLAMFFLLGGILALVGLNRVGRMGAEEFLDGLYLMPSVALGLLLARPLARWLDKGKTRVAVLAIAALAGVTVIVKTLWQG